MKEFVAESRKFLVALVGIAGVLLSMGLISGNAKVILSAVVAVGTLLGVYLAPNKPAAVPAT